MSLDPPPTSRVRYRVVALTLLLVAIAYLDRVCISMAAPAMQADLRLNDEQMGLVFSAFTLTYGLFEMPSGWLADRFGARFALTRIVVFWSAMSAATGLATGFASLVALRGLFGAGEAGAFPSITRVYRAWLPAKEVGRAFGLAIMTGAIGAAMTQPLVMIFLAHASWRLAFAAFGSVGLVWATAWSLWYRNDPSDHRSVGKGELATIRATRATSEQAHDCDSPPLGKLLASRTVVALSVIHGGTIYGWYFYLTWLPTYLLRGRGFDMKHAGWLSSGPLIGIALGVFLGGYLTDVLPRRIGPVWGRRLPGLVGLPCGAIAVVGAALTPSAIVSASLLSVAACFAAFGVAPAWTLCVEIGGPFAGVVSGAMNTCGNLGGALSSAVAGYYLRAFGSWNAGLFTMALFYVVAGAFWMRVDPKPSSLPLPDRSRA